VADVWCVGAGAIGGTVAARLVRAGHHLVVVDADPEHVARLRDPGLVVDGDDPRPVPLDASLPDDAAALDRPCDLLLLAVRSEATERALRPFAGRARDVVSLQNGLNESRIAALVGAERTIGCVVSFAATWVEAGRVELTAEGGLTIGRLDGSQDPRLEAARDVLADAFPTDVTTDVHTQLWTKLLVNSVTVLGAVGGVLTGEILAPEHRAVVRQVIAEGRAVADAEGVALPALPTSPEDLDAMLDMLAGHAGQVKSVTLRDFELGRRPEIDAVTGEIVRRGERHGVPTPVNAAAYRILSAIAERQRRPQAANLEELAGAVP
jgi:2-dehydropantoate 2-reductase